MNHEVFRIVDIIVLINVLRQLTSSHCSHICKRLKSQQLCQLHQFSKKVQKRTPRKVLSVSIFILSKNILSAAVAIQSNIASLVFLGQLCIAYLYATKVARAILIAYRQFSYKKHLARYKVFSFVFCFPVTN